MKKYTCILFCLLFLTLFLPVGVKAETRNMSFNIPETIKKDAVFSVRWDNNDVKADVELISPAGKVYSAGKTPDAIASYKGTAIIYVGKAVKGVWKVKVTGKNIGRLSVDTGRLPGTMDITEFKIKKSGGIYNAEYKIEDAPEEVFLEIYADTDNSGIDGILVWNGYGRNSGKISFTMDSLKSGEYHLYLMVTCDSTYNYKYSDNVISWQRPGYLYEIGNVHAGKYNDGYYIEWDYEDNENYDVYIWDSRKNLYDTINITGKGFYYGEFSKGQKKVYLAVVYPGRECNYQKFEVNKASGVNADVVYSIEEDITSQNSITASISYKGNCEWKIFKDSVLVSGPEKEAGDYRIRLEDGNNKFYVLIIDYNDNILEFDKEIYVDTIAPALSVAEDVNKMVTSEDYIWLSGYSEAGAELTLNGDEVGLMGDYFNIKAELKDGENELRLVAKDMAGNVSEYVAMVTYQPVKPDFLKKYLWVIVICVLAVVYIVYFSSAIYHKKKTGRGQK